MANKGLSNKDSFQKINFLNQASQMIAKKNTTLSCYYTVLMKEVAKKSVLKIDPSVKRQFCKRCGLAFIIDTTCDIQEKDQKLQMKCSKCGYIRQFPMKTGYKLWVEKPEAIMEAPPPKVIKEQMVGKRSKKNLTVVAPESGGSKDSGDVR